MLITNARIVTWEENNRILEDHAVCITNEIISDIGPSRELISKYPQEETLDANGQFLMPGNICAHTHFYGAFARGMAIPGDPPEDFSEILSKLWWPLDKALLEEDIYFSAMICLIDAIKSGTTTLFDHHSSPNAVDGSLDIIANAVEESGLRSVLCYEVSDRNGTRNSQEGINENIRFINKVSKGGSYSSRLKATFGLHASLTLYDETLDYCSDHIPDQSGFHIHAAEAQIDQKDSLEKSGLRVIERLNKFNILGSSSILAHAVHVNDKEIDLLEKTKTWVTHQPRSNMNNGVGVAPVERLMQAGVKLCLGNDGFSNAMWEEWKTAYLIHKSANLDNRAFQGHDLISVAVYNNSDLASWFFKEALLGKVVKGAYADIILVDYHAPTALTEGNIPWHILFGFNENQITTTIVAGKVLMKNRELTFLDEERIHRLARVRSKEVWKRYETISKIKR